MKPDLRTSRELRVLSAELLKKSAEVIEVSKATVAAAEAARRDTRELLELLRKRQPGSKRKAGKKS